MKSEIKIYEQGLEEYPKTSAVIGNFFYDFVDCFRSYSLLVSISVNCLALPCFCNNNGFYCSKKVSLHKLLLSR